jgi:hypothetical protein
LNRCTLIIAYWCTEGKGDRYGEIAEELLKVDVILTVGSAIAAAKQATATIPSVFAAALVAVASGFVDRLARPLRTANIMSTKISRAPSQSTSPLGSRPKST